MEKIELQHIPHPNFSSHMATGLVVHGTLGDGTVQMLFFRDAVRLKAETFSVVEEQQTHAKTLTLTRQGEPKVEFFREDVVALAVPADKFLEFAEVIDTVRRKLLADRAAG